MNPCTDLVANPCGDDPFCISIVDVNRSPYTIDGGCTKFKDPCHLKNFCGGHKPFCIPFDRFKSWSSDVKALFELDTPGCSKYKDRCQIPNYCQQEDPRHHGYHCLTVEEEIRRGHPWNDSSFLLPTTKRLGCHPGCDSFKWDCSPG